MHKLLFSFSILILALITNGDSLLSNESPGFGNEIIGIAEAPEAEVKSEISGKINFLDIRDAGIFDQNEVIAKIDCQEKELKKNHIELQEANAEYKHKTAQDLARHESISKIDEEDHRTNMKLRVIEHELTAIELKKCVIKAPSQIVVTQYFIPSADIYVEQGQTIIKGLLYNDLRVKFNMRQEEFNTYHHGNKFNFSVVQKGKNGERQINMYQCEIVSKSPFLQNGFFEVKAKVLGDSLPLPGTRGNIIFKNADFKKTQDTDEQQTDKNRYKRFLPK